jgi:predicted O-linked N-acetylglucosamine transferase (SPINDLY family)
VRDSFAAAGVGRERVVFEDYRARPDYLALHRTIDVALDTVPYNGHTTTLDALWMGVPVVTLAGPTVVGRAGASILANLGLDDLVARTGDDFVARTVALATDRERLRILRATLRARMESSVLMDQAGFARAIEAAYRGMWKRRCAHG